MSTATFVQGDGHMQMSYRKVGDKTANLVTAPTTLQRVTYDATTGTITNTEVDTIGLRLRLYNGSSSPTSLPQTLGTHTYTFTATGNYTEIRHNGSDKNLGVIWSNLLTVGEEYTLSYNVVSDDTLTVGGFVLSDLMVVEGSTAPSSYIPYGYEIPLPLASNCGMVNLGTLSWTYLAGRFQTTGTLSNAVNTHINFSTLVDCAYCSKYVLDLNIWNTGGLHDGIFGISSRVYVRDISFNGDVTAFKSAMSGVYLYYQRTTDDTWTEPTVNKMYLPKPLGRIYEGTEIDLGEPTWTYLSSGLFYADVNTLPTVRTGGIDGYCDGYTIYNGSSPSEMVEADMRITISNSHFSSSKRIFATNSKYTDATSFKAAMSGRKLYCPNSSQSSWSAPIFDKASLLGGGVYKMDEITLDGSESGWASYARVANTYYIGLEDAKASQGANVICTRKYEGASSQGTDKGVYCGATNIGSVQCGAFYFTDTDHADLASFLADLADDPITMYYITRVDDTESITAPTIALAEGINYLDCNATVAPSEGKVQYYGPEV